MSDEEKTTVIKELKKRVVLDDPHDDCTHWWKSFIQNRSTEGKMNAGK